MAIVLEHQTSFVALAKTRRFNYRADHWESDLPAVSMSGQQ